VAGLLMMKQPSCRTRTRVSIWPISGADAMALPVQSVWEGVVSVWVC
jgi:hypothetical protein